MLKKYWLFDSNAFPFVQDAMLADQLDVLNAQYAPYGVSFNLVGTTRTVNSGWADDSNQLAMKRSLRQGDYSTLNVYFQRVSSTSS